jgi:hypothetical protein
VVGSVWVQFKLTSIFTYFNADAHAVPFEVPKSTKDYYSLVSAINIFVMIAGTVIWGYGDMLI